MSYTKQKIIIRKAISQFKRSLKNAPLNKRHDIIFAISYNEGLLKELENTENELDFSNIPTLGKLRMVIEKDLKGEQQKFINDPNQSDTDLKRLALKAAFLEYYNDLEYSPDTPVVDYESDMTLRRDNKETDRTDFDFAPNKNKIYSRWMEKLNRYVREGRLGPEEYDEAVERGIPQGGAFEKQLDRYRKDIMQQLWQDYYKQRKNIWKTQ